MQQLLSLIIIALITLNATALRLEPIKYGDFNSWITRQITESKVIGGQEKTLYEIGPRQIIKGNKPYYNLGGSPWATSNVYARVSGITKGSNAVEPVQIGGSTAARLQCVMEHVKVLGLINMDVIAAGSIFLGRVFEPITSTKNPFKKMEMGIPYTKRPVALVFDYKIDMPPVNTRVRSSGLGKKTTLQGRDNAEIYLLLQKRWEDEKGNIHALRVGTARERYARSIPWTKQHRININYGDITHRPFYKPWMGLLSGAKAYYARNSKGQLLPVQEEGWAKPDETPTHILLMASTSCGEPYIGTEGITLYIDNINLAF